MYISSLSPHTMPSQATHTWFISSNIVAAVYGHSSVLRPIFIISMQIDDPKSSKFLRMVTVIYNCSTHSKSPRKVCVVCKKNKSRRKGDLCDACFVDNGKGLCANCTNSGYERMPRNIGGLCTVCITNRAKVINKCTKCNVGPQRQKGAGIWQACFKYILSESKIA